MNDLVVHNNQTFEAKYDDSKCDVVHLHFIHGGGLAKTVPWSEVYPQPGHACYDCGSTIPGHHTVRCDLTGPNDIKDLPCKGDTQHWTGEVKADVNNEYEVICQNNVRLQWLSKTHVQAREEATACGHKVKMVRLVKEYL